MIDVVFTYQHKAREIESLCLLKKEIEKRGFSTAFCCTFEADRIGKYMGKARVVVTSSLYDDASLWFFAYDVVGYTKKVINLQWEQVLSNSAENDLDCFHNPKGLARNALHLCWGEASKDRIVRGGVPPKNAIVTGAVHMDFLRPEFKSYFKNKEELGKEHSLNADRQWCLFISSFTMHNMTEEEYHDLESSYGDEVASMKKIGIDSRNVILTWIKRLLAKYPNMNFIYRPHPDETQDSLLAEMAKDFANFKVIGKGSVKQWILVCERNLVWFSTAAAEVDLSNRGFGILRPVDIPLAYDISFYKGAEFITEYETLERYIEQGREGSPLESSILKRYYDVDTGKSAYIKAADLIIETLTKEIHDMEEHPGSFHVFLKLFLKRIKLSVRKVIASIFGGSAKKIPVIGKSMEYHLSVSERMRRDLKKNYASREEIDAICAQIPV